MAAAEIRETTLAGLRWLTVTGQRQDAFRLLGQVARDDIHAVLAGMPEAPGLAAFVATDLGRTRLQTVTAATATAQPVQLAELHSLADGAGVDFQQILLANLRGDLGATDGTGCTDLAFLGESGYLAHNEDAAPELADKITVLTLRIDDAPAVTVHWYPGFVPSNTIAANQAGLVWGINHLQAQVPADAAGRHFVARGLQEVTSVHAACAYLKDHPSAGGYSYTIGQCGTTDIANVEAIAGHFDQQHTPGDCSLHWHTNNLRRLDPTMDAPGSGDSATDQLGSYQESVDRGQAAATLTPPDTAVGPWLQAALTGGCANGIHRTATGGDPLMTLTTTVTDLAAATVTIHSHHGDTETLTLHQYLGLADRS